ncbi:MAG: carbamoyltransferase [Verrucomicrobia bacterium]|nr:carbamoyltransferase [Verrucomicrobiota bacterium]MBU4289490.1 carbamoyltransferase [Verrucomicrobiota bacterium]MBU4429655.1 carbamoyltransferase [Verrucomicrobiota bacterium]MBU4496376.1 carbamoyltransferase [Verrucomicrobiota bacterium]MCG2678765.1 carbamoyltransferase [Kiritimatiellia bacterium]
MNILGISAYYHDSAAALVRDGEIIAAAQEERFSRKKHDAGFPKHAIRYCLAEGGIGSEDLDAVAFYDKPIVKFARILETYFSVAPCGLRSFMMAMPLWLKQKLWIPLDIEVALETQGIRVKEPLYFPEHHESHAASAFYPSPFQQAAILTLDGVGEWATSTIGVGRDHQLKILKELRFPHSLGLLYSAFTYFTGFRVNSGEYKLMGLAPYGEPRYVQRIMDHLLDLKEDGSFRMNLDYFNYLDGLTMTNEKFNRLFDGPPRKAEAELTKREMDIARSIQVVTEDIVLRMAWYARKLTGLDQLCLAGGVALNCVANGRLLREGIFKDIWIQPAAGDAGGALGAALVVWHQVHRQPRQANPHRDSMRGAYLGPVFEPGEIDAYLKAKGYSAERIDDPNRRADRIAQLMDEGQVVGLLQGRMEFGPRALGNRSIIGDARSTKMQSIMNLKIKYRESFRPFAPTCLEERVRDYFDLDRPSPYMLLVAPVRADRCRGIEESGTLTVRDRINQVRSDIPAITHVDYSARVQTVAPDTNPDYYAIIKAFEKRTGYGIIINTSFNVRGEPIVCTPEDAYRCFMRTEMDWLVLGPFVLDKKRQPAWTEKKNWRQDYVLD